MKQFAFPFSVYCKDDAERTECIKMLEDLGYKAIELSRSCGIMTNFKGINNTFTTFMNKEVAYDSDRHHVPHFDAALVRDIAAACTNDTWQVGEPWITPNFYGNCDKCTTKYTVGTIGHKMRRPTLSEICAHHGYEIKGRDIVKKSEQKQPEPKHKCSMEAENKRLQMVIEDMAKELAELRSKLKKIMEVAQ